MDDITAPGAGLGVQRLQQLTRLNYRWRKKDYYTQVTPDVLPTNQQFNRRGFTTQVSMQVGAGNAYLSQLASPLQTFTSSSQTNRRIASGVNPVSDPNLQATPLDANDGTIVGFTSTNSTGLGQASNQSVVNHRWAAALDKLYRRMYAANSDFSSQMLAIFGGSN